MIRRIAYTAWIKEEMQDGIISKLSSYKSRDDIYTISVFQFRRKLFFYAECIDTEVEPSDIIPYIDEYLEVSPNGKMWSKMYDIFHYSKPIEDEKWKRKEKTTPYAMLNRVNPDMLSSYIFYHFQYQEERPGDGNKYGSIFMDGNLLFFYLEEPEIIEEVSYKGLLNTCNSPASWEELMMQHFIPWEDTESVWRKDVKLIYNSFN